MAISNGLTAINAYTRQQVDRSDGNQTSGADDDSPASQVNRFVQFTDEMSAALTQFRNRRDYEKSTGVMEESSFERVLDDDVINKVDQLLNVLKQSQQTDLKQLTAFVRSLFPDDSDLVIVLRSLLRRRMLSEVAKKRLKELLNNVEKNADQKRLKSGINIALKARLFGKSIKVTPTVIRESYRQFLESESDEIDLYQEWITLYGYTTRSSVVNFMEGALLTDIDSLDPSCSILEFGDLLLKLRQIKRLNSVDKLFFENILNSDWAIEINNDEKSWLLFLICIIKQPEELDDFLYEVLGGALIIEPKKNCSVAIQRIYRVCKKLPLSDFFGQERADTLMERFSVLAEKAYRKELEMLRRG